MSFYEKTLGLTFVKEEEYAIVFDIGGHMLRLQKVMTFTPQEFAIFGLDVDNIKQTIIRLQLKDVEFINFEMMKQDDLGIWTAADGTKVAWFHDVDGNVLSLSQSSK